MRFLSSSPRASCPAAVSVLVLAFLALLVGCQERTGIHVTVSFPGVVTPQLIFGVASHDRTRVLIPPTPRPLTPATALRSPQDVVIYLPDVSGQVICRVEAAFPLLLAAEQMASVSAHEFVEVSLSLGPESGSPAPPDAGADHDGVISSNEAGVTPDADLLPPDATAPRPDAGVPIPDAALLRPDAEGQSDDGPAPPNPPRANGAACTGGAQCRSGFCADGVCCISDCSRTCMTCSAKDREGTCVVLPAGALEPHGRCASDPASPCGNTEICDGTGGCQQQLAGTVCGARSCVATGSRDVSVCDGAGVCRPGTVTDCGQYLCNPSTATCFVSCTSGTECVSGKCKGNGTCH